MIAGKNETNALAPSATLRSMNSFSSSRSQIRHKMVRSAQRCAASDCSRSRFAKLTTHGGSNDQSPWVRRRRRSPTSPPPRAAQVPTRTYERRDLPASPSEGESLASYDEVHAGEQDCRDDNGGNAEHERGVA